MKKRIAMVLAALAIVSSLGSSAVMARYDPVCTHPTYRSEYDHSYLVPDIYGHTYINVYRDYCTTCDIHVQNHEETADWVEHSYELTSYKEWEEVDENGIPSTKCQWIYNCTVCGWEHEILEDHMHT